MTVKNKTKINLLEIKVLRHSLGLTIGGFLMKEEIKGYITFRREVT